MRAAGEPTLPGLAGDFKLSEGGAMFNFRLDRTSRRHFLQNTAAVGAAASLGDLGFLSRLKPVSAAEAESTRGIAPVQPDIEPVVKLLEETPRDQLLEEVGKRIHAGLN